MHHVNVEIRKAGRPRQGNRAQQLRAIVYAPNGGEQMILRRLHAD